MIWERMIGHRPQIDLFKRAIERGRLAHGYLFAGPRGIGKQLFARLLAQCLFCERVPDAELDACGDCPSCRQMQADNHPDFLSIGLPEGKKSLPISLLVGDDKMRGRSGLCYEIAMAPMTASRRIAVINDAESMQEEAANSLLKTLEEPPQGAIMILLTPDTEIILPTIRSRCQPVRFSQLSDSQMLSLLEVQSPGVEGLDEIVSLAEGSLETARQLLEPGVKDLWKAVDSNLKGKSIDSMRAVKQVTAALEALPGDSASQREYMQWVVKFSIESFRKQLAKTENGDELDRLGSLLERCFDAESHLRQTMPIPLCLEALFTELGRRSRNQPGV
ncbi:DNA polymerase III subunit delta' [Planctomicrobium sp. SH668]|uniref:DNA polymerase III subunit delta' n=1 Tax=Planctomicrobium sp. SH668 TaxID=3448126 RepID=UPI003F5BC561